MINLSPGRKNVHSLKEPLKGSVLDSRIFDIIMVFYRTFH